MCAWEGERSCGGVEGEKTRLWRLHHSTMAWLSMEKWELLGVADVTGMKNSSGGKKKKLNRPLCQTQVELMSSPLHSIAGSCWNAALVNVISSKSIRELARLSKKSTVMMARTDLKDSFRINSSRWSQDGKQLQCVVKLWWNVKSRRWSETLVASQRQDDRK